MLQNMQIHVRTIEQITVAHLATAQAEANAQDQAQPEDTRPEGPDLTLRQDSESLEAERYLRHKLIGQK